LFVAGVPLLLIAFGVGMLMQGKSTAQSPQDAAAIAPSSPPLGGLFEGQGALTLGCAFWEVPTVQPYNADNQNLRTVLLQSIGDRDGVQTFLVFDGPRGTVSISGSRCAVSVDWNAFPSTPIPQPKSGP
jgi:hypothetical protein